MTRAPIRIQRSRAKGWKMPEGAVYVGSPTKWGNPYKVGPDMTVEWVVAMYDAAMWSAQMVNVRAQIAEELRGKDLACWCLVISHGKYCPCHADVLLSIANDIPMDEVIRENTRRATGETL